MIEAGETLWNSGVGVSGGCGGFVDVGVADGVAAAESAGETSAGAAGAVGSQLAITKDRASKATPRRLAILIGPSLRCCRLFRPFWKRSAVIGCLTPGFTCRARLNDRTRSGRSNAPCLVQAVVRPHATTWQGRLVSPADLYPDVPSCSLFLASCCSCHLCTPGSQSLPNVADGPTRGSLGTPPSRKACTYARSCSIRART